MNLIRDLFSIETPPKPKWWQAYIFSAVSTLLIGLQVYNTHISELWLLLPLTIWFFTLFINEVVLKFLQTILFSVFLAIHSISLILLALSFYIVFWPTGILIIKFKGDPMRRKFEPIASYRIASSPLDKDIFLRPY